MQAKSGIAVALLALISSTAVFAADTGGYATTTGGGDAKPIYVKTMEELESAVFWRGHKVIVYTGNEDAAIKAAEAEPCGQWKKPVREIIISASHVTIIGAPGSSANFGIRLRDASDIIIQDMTMGMIQGGPNNGDVIGIEKGSHNVWLHHNNFFNKNLDCPGTPDNDTTFDGMIDIRDNVDDITVSYNLIHDHPKVGLDGYSDNDKYPRHVTFHHNVYTDVHARLPLQRYGYSHEYNNLYRKITVSGINVRQYGQALIEGNWFEDAKNPVTSRDSPRAGYWDLRDNNIQSPADFAKYNIEWTTSDRVVKNADDWVTTKPFPMDKINYAYKADPVQCVHDHLEEVAGPHLGDKTLVCAPQIPHNIN